jgi:hypothetical protein
MCKSARKSVNHLLLNCLVAQELWNLVFVLFRVSWVMPRGVMEPLASWQDQFGRSSIDVIWNAIPHCLLWCLWCERNSRTFDGQEKVVPVLNFYFLQSLLEWLKASGLVLFTSMLEMLDSCFFRT